VVSVKLKRKREKNNLSVGQFIDELWWSLSNGPTKLNLIVTAHVFLSLVENRGSKNTSSAGVLGD